MWTEKDEAEKRLNLFGFFTDLLVKDGYNHNFFITDLINRNLIQSDRLVYAARIRKYWADYLKKGKLPVNVYIAMPYCMQRCSYCIYFKMLAKTPAEVEDYKDNLIAYIKYFSATLKSMKIANVYFGGGTPSLFTEKQLGELSLVIDKYLQMDGALEKSFECNPYSATPEKLKLIRKAGFNRISFGAQSFTRAGLRNVNRGYQTYSLVKKMLDSAKAVGFEHINMDMILGLKGETASSFLKSFSRALELSPTDIRLYQLQPLDTYLEKTFSGNIAEFDEHLKKIKAETFKKACELADKFGFTSPDEENFLFYRGTVGAVEFHNKKNLKPRGHYTTSGALPYLGLGHAALSYIPGKVVYNSTPLKRNAAQNQFRCQEFSQKNSMVYWFLNTIANEKYISRREFADRFKKDVFKVFKKEFQVLNYLGEFVKKDDLIGIKEKSQRKRFELMFFLFEYGKFIKRLNEMAGAKEDFIKLGKFRLPFKLKYSSARGPLLYRIEFFPGKKYKHHFKPLYPRIRKMMSSLYKEKPSTNINDFRLEFLKKTDLFACFANRDKK